MKVAKWSVLSIGRLYFPGETSGSRFCQRLGRPQDHSAAGEFKPKSNKNPMKPSGIEAAQSEPTTPLRTRMVLATM